jgi:hypothetical protein
MDDISEVAYCGLYCPNCGMKCHLPQRASALVEEMKAHGWDKWGPVFEGFVPFWKFLQGLADTSVPKHCRDDTCGDPNCPIRKCAEKKGIDACPFCDDYPCKMISDFSKSNPTMIFDGQRMKEIGMRAWIAEQETRRRNGFCYGDIRCGEAVIYQG